MIHEKLRNFFLLAMYCGLFTTQVLAVRYAKNEDGTYSIPVTGIIVYVELSKLVFSVIMYGLNVGEDDATTPKDFVGRVTYFFKKIVPQTFRTCLNLNIPAFCYCLYNNLIFLNVSLFGPGVYKVLMNVRILISGVLTIMVFRRKLTIRQWVALAVLTIGCATIEIENLLNRKEHHDGTSEFGRIIVYLRPLRVFVVCFQAFLSSFAGVMNEKYLKGDKDNLSIHTQNFWLYTYSIFWNLIFTLVSRQSFAHPMELLNVKAILLVSVWSLGGISASFILKYMNVITKAFASSIEVLTTNLMSAIIFSTVLTKTYSVSAVLVALSIILYYYEPETKKEQLPLVLEESDDSDR